MSTVLYVLQLFWKSFEASYLFTNFFWGVPLWRIFLHEQSISINDKVIYCVKAFSMTSFRSYWTPYDGWTFKVLSQNRSLHQRKGKVLDTRVFLWYSEGFNHLILIPDEVLLRMSNIIFIKLSFFWKKYGFFSIE